MNECLICALVFDLSVPASPCNLKQVVKALEGKNYETSI